MNIKPTVLLSDFTRITFPHYTKVKDETTAISGAIVFQSAPPVVGELVAIHPLKLNTRVYTVTSTDGRRKARGDWNFVNGEHPAFCEFTASFQGFYDPGSQSVSPTFIAL